VQFLIVRKTQEGRKGAASRTRWKGRRRHQVGAFRRAVAGGIWAGQCRLYRADLAVARNLSHALGKST